MAKVAISNGHGLRTPGKRTPTMPDGRVIHEWQFNHPTAKKVEAILKAHGVQTLMVSDTEADTSLTARVNAANNWKADVYVSIHYNAFRSMWGDHGGIETLYYGRSIKGKQLADMAQKNLIAATGLRNRGIKVRDDLYELKATSMPAFLVECGFMDNLNEAKLMLDNNFQQKCAESIAKSILAYLGVAYKGGQSVPVKPVPPKVEPQQPIKNDNDHWANKHFESLISKGFTISEKNFDKAITRGEIFALIDNNVDKFK